MDISRLLQRPSEENRRSTLAIGFALIALIAFVDWIVKPNIGIGFLYFLPILLLSRLQSRGRVVIVAVTCAVLREVFSPFSHGWISVPRTFLVWLGFVGVGLFVRELVRNQEMEVDHLQKLSIEVTRRAAAEEQLRVLVETSPAAILLANQAGNLVLSNQAAATLFVVDKEQLTRRNLKEFLPSMAGLQGSSGTTYFRSVSECRAYRGNGELFQAQVLFSTFDMAGGRCLAAIVFDVSEQMREREESGLKRLLTGSEIAVVAVSHEIRNMCGAASVVHSNLARLPALTGNEDFDALGVLIEGLRRLASSELKKTRSGRTCLVDLQKVLDDLRIIIESSFRESGILLCWSTAAQIPLVEGDHHSLLQVFLNMALNSERAMAQSPQKQFSVNVEVGAAEVGIRLSDTGAGIPDVSRLFEPFQAGATGSGLGLYISRAIVRSFGGEIRHEPQAHGTCFVVELKRGDRLGDR